MSGRSCSLTLQTGDHPGQTRDISGIIVACGGNITEILHLRTNEGTSVNDCCLKIEIETHDGGTSRRYKDALRESDFDPV